MSTISFNTLPSRKLLHTQSHPLPAIPKNNEVKQKNLTNSKNNKKIPHSKLGYMGSVILENARYYSEMTHKKFFMNFKVFQEGVLHMHQVIKFSSLFDVVLLPILAVNIAKQTKSFLQGKRLKIDSIIELIAEVALFGRSLTMVAMGLVSFKGISIKILNRTASLFFATSVLSFATTASTYRTYIKMRKLEQKIAKIGQLNDLSNQASLDYFRNCYTFIKSKEDDKEFITATFNCSFEKLEIRLLEIEKEAESKINSPLSEDQQSGRQLLNTTLKTLKGHIHHVGSISRNNVIISTIGLIAAVVLFIYPIALMTYYIPAASTAASVGVLTYHKIAEYHYAHDLGLQRKWYEWITC
ncbi:MAG: hypothetical protein H0X29_04365 [Parachlamydiaceae bacterium]|nr:hypothetical protein [Parachlamydiaceae bacterium]